MTRWSLFLQTLSLLHHFLGLYWEIVATTVNVPFREVPARNMARELPHWSYFEIVEVRLRGGSTGFGETMLYYPESTEGHRWTA